MTEYPKYQRLMLDVEVEILDPITAKAFTFDTTEEGGIGLEGESPDWHIGRLVAQLLAEQLVDRSPETGVRLIGSSVIPRQRDESGAYVETQLPAMPGRNDDGSLVNPPGWDD